MNQEHDAILRAMLCAIAAKMVGDVDSFAFKFIRRSVALQMPDRESLKALGEAAECFTDNGAVPDGDLLIQAARRFTKEQLTAGINAGGNLISAYEFDYPARVLREDTNLPGWCGYNSTSIGFAVSFEISLIVCAISLMNADMLRKEQD
jgi:hypothetical protein